MRAISIIKSEHKNLGAVLYSLDKLIEEIDDGKQPDFSIFHGLFTYIDRFLDRYHHPKENHYLFPKLLARAPAVWGTGNGFPLGGDTCRESGRYK